MPAADAGVCPDRARQRIRPAVEAARSPLAKLRHAAMHNVEPTPASHHPSEPFPTLSPHNLVACFEIRWHLPSGIAPQVLAGRPRDPEGVRPVVAAVTPRLIFRGAFIA